MKRLSPSRAWAALASLAMLAACGQGVSAPTPQTRAQAMRVQDADPAEVARMKAAVAPLVSKDPANVRTVREANGAVRREFVHGFKTVAIVHRGANGQSTVTCVDSVDGVDRALTSARPAEVR